MREEDVPDDAFTTEVRARGQAGGHMMCSGPFTSVPHSVAHTDAHTDAHAHAHGTHRVSARPARSPPQVVEEYLTVLGEPASLKTAWRTTQSLKVRGRAVA